VVPRIARSATDPATEADLLAAIAPIRKAVFDRWTNRPDLDPDDIVQETLARVWAERWRLERGALLGYAVVVARNLVTSAERREDRHRRHEHRLAEPSSGEDPASDFLTAEEGAAVLRALAALREEDRQLLLEHEVAGVEARVMAAAHGVRANTLAARLARARARLRVEHVLALRRVTLPTRRCRSVLEALSLGDRSRQRTLLAAEHLLGCRTCAALAEPLVTRRRSLTAVVPAALLVPLGRLWSWIRANPVPSTAGTVGAVAIAVAVMATRSPAPAPSAARPSPTPPATLTVGGTTTLPAPRVRPLVGAVGQTAVARDVPVQSVPADEGFWVGGAPGDRVWVQLATHGRESGVRVRPGQRASFSGAVARVAADTPAKIGLTAAEGSAELRLLGAYVTVDPRQLVLR
jgi:RNA polymerase sigma factor (sigma-70 family)